MFINKKVVYGTGKIKTCGVVVKEMDKETCKTKDGDGDGKQVLFYHLLTLGILHLVGVRLWSGCTAPTLSLTGSDLAAINHSRLRATLWVTGLRLDTQ